MKTITDLTKEPKTKSIQTRKESKTETNLLVDLNTDGALGNVPYTTSAAMVELVRHTFVDGAVNLDVDIFADLVRPQVCSESNVTLLPEGPGEEVSGTRPKSMAGRHLLL